VAGLRLGIDIGGTFTDFVLMDEMSGALHFGKTLTTYPDPSQGIINGMAELLPRIGISAGDLKGIVHGTTLVTNALIERKGAKTAFITTKGFRDVLEIGRELRYDIYDINLTVPEPIVPRNLRYEVSERVNKDGDVLTPLDQAELLGVLEELRGKGINAIAVCYLHSFMNPYNEQKAAALITEHFPEMHVSISSRVMPEIREYERSVVTAMNAYVQPVAEQYLAQLDQELRQTGFAGTLHIIISSGRLTTIEGAKQNPIQMLESGPAGGSMAGIFYGHLIAKPDLLTFDMGGTTAKASTILNHQPQITNQFEVARVRRFKKGSGLPVRIPVIDMIEIGAGGGSIAYVDRLGLLRVGPESAGADPGPVCYGLGGERPTVTDADLILGYLDADYFLGGKMKLDVDRAKQSMEQHIAQPLGISVVEAAAGIHRIVNENMANAARVHILEKGLDPRRFSMLAFGGAGPVHAFQVARLLRSPQLIAPIGAGVMSALGFLVSPVAIEHVRSYLRHLDDIDWATINHMLEEMEAEGREFLRRAAVPDDEITVTRFADMRYSGQGHEIAVAIPTGTLTSASIPRIEENFYRAYEQLYSRSLKGVAIESVSWRLLVSAAQPQVSFNYGDTDSPSRQAAQKGSRAVYFPEIGGYIDCPVYDRYLLRMGESFDGPAILEERESTLVIGPQSRVMIDGIRNAVVQLGELRNEQ
jgi:N-methylhydantoinase A